MKVHVNFFPGNRKATPKELLEEMLKADEQVRANPTLLTTKLDGDLETVRVLF